MAKQKDLGELKLYEVRWYRTTTGAFLGETKIHADSYPSRDALELEIAEAFADRDDVEVKITEVYERGTRTGR